jgi:hypothetical protein
MLDKKYSIIQSMNNASGIIYVKNKDIYFILDRENNNPPHFFNEIFEFSWGRHYRPIYFKLVKVFNIQQKLLSGIPIYSSFPDEVLCQFGKLWFVINYHVEIGEEIKKLYD